MKSQSGNAGKRFRASIDFYIFLLPAFLYMALFIYWPMYGIQIAFRDFSPVLGVSGSPWVGMEYFRRFTESYLFWDLIKNTLLISMYQFLAGFPTAIVLAIALHYAFSARLKRLAQTISYAPHFISQVVMVGMLLVFLSPHNGIVNSMLEALGFEAVNFMSAPELFRHIYVWSGIWQNTGFQSIIYLAVLTGVSPELHEAAIVDGAGKWKRLWNIDFPCLVPTVIIMLILNLGSIMGVGFEKIYLMQNDANLIVSDVLSTYIYRLGLTEGQYSYTTAVGMFNNLVNLIMLLAANFTAKRLSGKSLF